MLFRIKIAAYGDERVRFAVEQTLHEQSSLQRLSLPFLRRDELSLGPGSAREGADPFTPVGNRHGARSTKMKVDNVKSCPGRH